MKESSALREEDERGREAHSGSRTGPHSRRTWTKTACERSGSRTVVAFGRIRHASRGEDKRPRLAWHLLVEERGGEGFSAAGVHVALADFRVAVRGSSVLVASRSESRSPQLTFRRAAARLGSVVRRDPFGRGRSRRTARSAAEWEAQHIRTGRIEPTPTPTL